MIFILCSEDLIERLGNFTVWSAALWVVSLLFGLASVVSFLVAPTRFERGSPSRRPLVLADRFNGTFDCRCLLDLLGHHRNTNLGLGRGQPRRKLGEARVYARQLLRA